MFNKFKDTNQKNLKQKLSGGHFVYVVNIIKFKRKPMVGAEMLNHGLSGT